jgi:hypothetical protein
MYIPFAFNGNSTSGVPTTGLVTWLTPASYPGTGSTWIDVNGSVNAVVSGSLTTAGPDGWTFASGTYLDFGTGSYQYAQNEQTIIMYGSLVDNDAVQTIWSKGGSDQYWWVPFTGSFVCYSTGPDFSGNWSGSRFDLSFNGGQFGFCVTTPTTPSSYINVLPVDYNPAVYPPTAKQMYTFRNAPFNSVPSSVQGTALYINETVIGGAGGGFGEGLNNSNPMYFGKGVTDASGQNWPMINQPTISDILVYSRALTGVEIASIYNYFLLNR